MRKLKNFRLSEQACSNLKELAKGSSETSVIESFLRHGDKSATLAFEEGKREGYSSGYKNGQKSVKFTDLRKVSMQIATALQNNLNNEACQGIEIRILKTSS